MICRLRPVHTDAELEAWRRVRLEVLPDSQAATVAELRALEGPERLLLLAELDGRLAGCGLADRSDTGHAFLAPRVLPAARRRGVGSALLLASERHAVDRGFDMAVAHVEGVDPDSVAFARHFGFEEVDRQVEQVRLVGDESEPPPLPAVEVTTVADRPELLREAYPLAAAGYAELALAMGPASVPLDRWLREEATLPAGSFVALNAGEVVGYAGLCRWEGEPDRAENGLTVVRRDWRRQGLATALKRRQLGWAAANGIREVVTWTQRGNEAMQRVNEGLGYRERSVSFTFGASLPLRTARATT